MTQIKDRYDVIVVGARVAGAATALQLAQAGMSVLVVDRTHHGADTLSTHALMRGGVVQLQRLGVLPDLRARGTPAVRKTTFHYGDEAVAVEIKDRDGVDALYAPRRTVLDTAVADAAWSAGVDMRYSVRLRALDREASGRVCGVVLEDATGSALRVGADLVIGADGIRSTVARLAEAPKLLEGIHASGTAYGYWFGLPLDGYHWYYAEGASAGVIPTTGGDSCVFVAVTDEAFRGGLRLNLQQEFHRLLSRIAPEVAQQVAGRGPTEPLRGFPGTRGYLRQASGPGWALVGDAGFFRDPITAHGITDALRDATLLTRAYARGGEAGLADYARERDAWAIDMLNVSDEIASFRWDLDSVKPMHKRLSKIMARESEMLAGLDAPARVEHARRAVTAA